MPVSAINGLRRDGVEKLNSIRKKILISEIQ